MDKLYPLEAYQATVLKLFHSISLSNVLPKRPYCSDDLSQGIYPRSQHIAIKKRYIQLNPPQMQYWMVFDIDRPNAAYDWYDLGLPPPCAVVVNPDNGHCHIIYLLETPVCTSDFACLKPLKYLAAIEQAITEKLNADVHYSGLIAKNPFSEHWHLLPVALHVRYSLDELADYVDLTNTSKRSRKPLEAFALGRNCALFDSLRHTSYQAIRDYRKGNINEWRDFVLSQARAANVFSTPLPDGEVKSIAKSVANWVWKHMKHDSLLFTEALKKRQSVRGKASGKARQSKANNQRIAAQALKNEGVALSEIARTLGIARTKVMKWKLE